MATLHKILVSIIMLSCIVGIGVAEFKIIEQAWKPTAATIDFLGAMLVCAMNLSVMLELSPKKQLGK